MVQYFLWTADTSLWAPKRVFSSFSNGRYKAEAFKLGKIVMLSISPHNKVYRNSIRFTLDINSSDLYMSIVLNNVFDCNGLKLNLQELISIFSIHKSNRMLLKRNNNRPKRFKVYRDSLYTLSLPSKAYSLY